MTLSSVWQILCWIADHAIAPSVDSPGIVPATAWSPVTASKREDESRVRILLSEWGVEDADLDLLARSWDREFARCPAGPTVGRLKELARDSSSRYYRSADEGERWRRRLGHRLTVDLRLPAVLPEPDAECGADELDLRGIGVEWPAELLGAEAFRVVPSLMPGRVPDLPLEKVWVELHLVDTRAVAPGPLAAIGRVERDERTQRLLGRSTDLRNVLRTFSGVTFFVGDPGSGKSTLVNWVARETIRDQRLPFLVPLLVRLREYGRLAPKQSLLDHALRRCRVTDGQIEPWSRALERMAVHSPQSVIILLDGLDELPRNDHRLRARVLEEIESLGRTFTVLVTTRPDALPPHGDRTRVSVYRVTELTPASSDDLLDKWCRAASIPPDDIARLKERVHANADLQRMIRNPFLLTCLSTIAFQCMAMDKDLPSRRSDVYRECMNVFKSYRHPRQSRLLTDTDVRLMGKLAFWLLHDAPHAPRLVFDDGDVRQACGEDAFFHEAVEPCRLVHQWDTDRRLLYFSHATFHEYLAAEHLFVRGGSKYQSLLREKTFDGNWAEVFAFLGARDTDPASTFWCAARAMAERRDRFGGVWLILASWLREAGALDGGRRLLGGLNVFDELWKEIFRGVDPKRFIAAAAELAPELFASRVEKACAEGTIGPLHREFLRVLKQVPLARFSNLFAAEILDPSSESSGLPQEHRLTRDSLDRLREELVSERHDERVSRRVIQVLGLARDFRSIPLLEALATEPGPLQSSAIEALGLIGGPEAFRVLDRILPPAYAGGTQRGLVIRALGEMHEERATRRLGRELAATARDDPRASDILFALQDHTIGGDLATLVLGFLESLETQTRDHAACVLHGARSSPDISAALARLARFDPEDEVRESALLSFEHHSRPEDIDWLERIVRNSDDQFEPSEREAALMAIGDLAGRKAVSHDRIVPLLEHCLTQSGLEKTAVNIWGDLGPSHADRIVQLCRRVLTAPSERPATVDTIVAEEACRVLGEQQNNAAIDVLLEIARADRVVERVREAAARAVTRIAPERLLAETSDVCHRALGKFSLETGRLVFDSGMLNESGEFPSAPQERERTAHGPMGAVDGSAESLSLPREPPSMVDLRKIKEIQLRIPFPDKADRNSHLLELLGPGRLDDALMRLADLGEESFAVGLCHQLEQRRVPDLVRKHLQLLKRRCLNPTDRRTLDDNLARLGAP